MENSSGNSVTIRRIQDWVRIYFPCLQRSNIWSNKKKKNTALTDFVSRMVKQPSGLPSPPPWMERMCSTSSLDFRLALISSWRKLCPPLLIWRGEASSSWALHVWVALQPLHTEHPVLLRGSIQWGCYPPSSCCLHAWTLFSQTSSPSPPPLFPFPSPSICRGVWLTSPRLSLPQPFSFLAFFKAASRPLSEFRYSLWALQD